MSHSHAASTHAFFLFVAGALASCGGGGYGGGGGMNPPATLDIAVEPATITIGDSATITWNSNARRCTASGDWTGDKAASGTESVTPAATGEFTYSMVCSGGGYGSSQTGSATLTVNAARVAGLWMGDACCDRSESFRIAGLTSDGGDYRFLALGTHYVGKAGRAPRAYDAVETSLAGGRQSAARAFRLLAVAPGVEARPSMVLNDALAKPLAISFSVPFDRSAGSGAPQGTYTTFLGNGYTLTVTIDARGDLLGADTNGCLLRGRVSARPGVHVYDVTHVVTGCGNRNGRYDGLAAALVDASNGGPGLLLSTSNRDAAIGWRLSR
jgi:hypothetical protein